MKTFEKTSAQGDLFIRRIDALPTDAELTEVPADANGQHIVAHSETGHNHFFEAEGVHFFTAKDPMVCYLSIDENHAGAVLQHARPFDTHESIVFGGGFYELRRQREYTPEGWRRVED